MYDIILGQDKKQENQKKAGGHRMEKRNVEVWEMQKSIGKGSRIYKRFWLHQDKLQNMLEAMHLA